jgi:hypothetical protein
MFAMVKKEEKENKSEEDVRCKRHFQYSRQMHRKQDDNFDAVVCFALLFRYR